MHRFQPPEPSIGSKHLEQMTTNYIYWPSKWRFQEGTTSTAKPNKQSQEEIETSLNSLSARTLQWTQTSSRGRLSKNGPRILAHQLSTNVPTAVYPISIDLYCRNFKDLWHSYLALLSENEIKEALRMFAHVRSWYFSVFFTFVGRSRHSVGPGPEAASSR